MGDRFGNVTELEKTINAQAAKGSAPHDYHFEQRKQGTGRR